MPPHLNRSHKKTHECKQFHSSAPQLYTYIRANPPASEQRILRRFINSPNLLIPAQNLRKIPQNRPFRRVFAGQTGPQPHFSCHFPPRHHRTKSKHSGDPDASEHRSWLYRTHKSRPFTVPTGPQTATDHGNSTPHMRKWPWAPTQTATPHPNAARSVARQHDPPQRRTALTCNSHIDTYGSYTYK